MAKLLTWDEIEKCQFEEDENWKKKRILSAVPQPPKNLITEVGGKLDEEKKEKKTLVKKKKKLDTVYEDNEDLEEFGKEGKFRFCRQDVGLTYAQSGDLKWGDVMGLLKSMGPVLKYAISTEEHKLDGQHIHVYCKWQKRLDIRNCRAFDIQGRHPNIRKVDDWERWVHYVTKDGIYEMENCDFYINPKGCKKKWEEIQFWKSLRVNKLRTAISYPINLPNDCKILKAPSKFSKKRNWLFHGPANTGKSEKLQSEFRMKRVMMAGDDEKTRFERYDGEDYIWYDDKYNITKAEICDVTQVVQNQQEVFGRPRYTKVDWKIDQVRTIIISVNKPPSYIEEDWFRARFWIVYVTDRQWEGPENTTRDEVEIGKNVR